MPGPANSTATRFQTFCRYIAYGTSSGASCSTDVIPGLYYAHQWIPHRFESFVSGSYKWNTENDLNYRFGVEGLLNAGVSYLVGERWSWSVQLNGRRTAADRFLGHEVPSTGSTLINVTPGMRCQVSTSTSFYAFLQVPLYQDVNDAQLAPRTGLLTGLSKSF